ncbi:MAG: hypothetical protein J6K19_01010 [Prevotella sp.]|nr:hypothetical protein [Prevotella sp.]
MYDFDIWEGCLSFLSLSVVWNFGCIWVKNNPIKRLFESVINKRDEDTKSYRDECGKRMEERTATLHSKDNWQNKNVYLIFGKLVSQYLKVDKIFEDLQYCTQRIFDPVCFSYACFILGCHSLLGLLLIPVIKSQKLDWILNAFISFSAFVVITLFILLIIDIKLIFKGKNEDKDENFSTKYLVWEVFWVLLGILLSIILSNLPCISFIFSYLEPYVYDATVILPYISFIVCFIWYLIGRIVSWENTKKAMKCKKEFDNLYDELKREMDE